MHTLPQLLVHLVISDKVLRRFSPHAPHSRVPSCWSVLRTMAGLVGGFVLAGHTPADPFVKRLTYLRRDNSTMADDEIVDEPVDDAPMEDEDAAAVSQTWLF